MRKHYLPLAVALALTATASAQSRFDSRSMMAVDLYQESLTDPASVAVANFDFPFEFNPLSRSVPESDIIAIVSEGVDLADIEAMGIEIREVIDNVIIAHASLDDIIALADTDLVQQVTFPKELKPLNDRARSASKVNQILSGTDGLEQAYDGTGVITGIFDVGMDPNHVNFKEEDGYSRILNLWVYTYSGGVSQYGPARISGFSTDDASGTHGTHTMGSLAGSYKGTSTFANVLGSSVSVRTDEPMPYYGMAPGASILAACGPSTSANILASLRAISNRITTEDLPGVLSLSFGDNLGPHDGSDATTLALNNIAKQRPLFIAAGNEGDMNRTFVGDFTAQTTQYGTFLVPAGSSTKGEIQIWAANNEPLTVTLGIYYYDSREMFAEYDFDLGTKTLTTSETTSSSSIYSEDFAAGFSNSTVSVSASIDPANNRYNATLRYNLTRKNTNASNRYMLAIIVKGQNGQHFDLVQQCDEGSNLAAANMQSRGVEGYFDGNNSMSISNMACGPDMICIGAYNTRLTWGTLGSYISGYNTNSGYNVGYIAGYSSYGTLYNGTTLPVACAPGSGIISSVSQYWVAAGQNVQYMCGSAPNGSKTSYWDAMQGTSMATPIAAGIGALWLQANPNLTAADIKDIVKQTAVTDSYVTSTAEDRRVAWGAGKIDALAGIKAAINWAGVADVKIDQANVVVINGLNGWEVTVPGAPQVATRLYDVNGRLVASQTVKGDSAELSASSLAPGIYIMQVNDTFTKRVIVK